MSSISDAMKTLTAQYYNALTRQLNLDPNQFQLTQGQIALGATSQDLWTYLDSIPPMSITNSWSPGGQNTFSSQYGLLISRLMDPSSSNWQQAMGDWLTQWTTYLHATPTPAGQTLAEFFQSWALKSGMPPSQAQQVASLYAAALNGPIFSANETYGAAGGQVGLKAYTETIESATNAILANTGSSVSLDSATESSDVTRTWAEGAVDGWVEDLFGGVETSYDDLASTLITSGIDIQITFAHVATIPAKPLSQGTIVAGPTTYDAWYVPAALAEGYTNNNNEVWQDGTPGWADFFGPSGSFQRTAQGIVVVDGISITMTSSASFSSSDQARLQAAFSGGFFPFFGIEASGGWSKSTTSFDQGQISVSQSCPVGNPQILGLLQTPMSSCVAAQTLAKAILADRSKMAGIKPNSTVRIVDSKRAGATVGVAVNWAPAAFAAMQAAHPTPGVQQVIFTGTNSWAANNAPFWAIGSMHQYLGATAQRVAGPGGTVAALIVSYV